MSFKPDHCLECFKRSLTNPSGRANCNGLNPCKWCTNKKTTCTYGYNPSTFGLSGVDTATPPEGATNGTGSDPSDTHHAEDTQMIITNMRNGDITVSFSPDPENLGAVDPYDLGASIDPFDLPVVNYDILVKAAKRKRAVTLTKVVYEDEPAPAKRLRGGIDQSLLDDEERSSQGRRTPASPPPPPPHQPPAQNLDPNARLLQSVVEASQAATQMCLQLAQKLSQNDGGKDDTSDGDRRNSRLCKIHRLDLVDEDDTLSKIDTQIPRMIIQVFEGGWKVHFSFFLLTNEFCESQEAHKLPGDKLLIGRNNTVYTQTGELPTGGKDETEIDLPGYMQACPRFIWLIKNHLSDELADAWEVHCSRILHHERCDKIWHLLMRYDISIRRRATREPLRPQNWHQDVFDQIETDWNREQNQKQRKNLEDQAATLQAQLSGLLAQAGRTMQNPSTSSNAPSSHNLSSTAGPARSGQSSFRDSFKSGQGHSDAQEPRKTRCFNCSRWNHIAARCNQSTFPDGLPTLLDAAICRASGAHTSAPSVVPLNMEPSLAPNTDLRSVTPNLVPNAWESTLRDLGLLDEFGDIPSGLREGFRIGAAGPVCCTTIHQNHKSALDRPHVIDQHITSELAAGRYFGPFTHSELESLIGPFHTAPLGTVDKASAPGKFRIVQDFSYPRSNNTLSPSLNSQINSADFPCSWGFFHDVVRALYDLPPGSMAATCDVDAAFRQIPIHPDDRPHTVVAWNGLFYVDAFLPFGVASANGIFGRPGDAMARIYSLRGFGIILKWVDDFLFIQSPTSSHASHPPRFSLEAIYELANLLGWPWKLSKTMPFANVFIYLGFEWDITRKWVSLPPAKREKYHTRLTNWLHANSVSLNATEKVSGTLIHCTLAVPCGRPHIAAILAFEASFPQAYSKRFLKKPIPPAARAEAEWWLNVLASDICGSSIAKPPPPHNIMVASDVSTSFGLGVVLNNTWWSWRLLGGWKSDQRDIGWAEAVALELAVDGVITLGVRNASITCACDNQGVVYAWAAGRSRNPQQNAVFMSIMNKAAIANLSIKVEYIRSAENPTDEPSRGVAPTSLSRATFPIPIPSAYAPYMASATL